MLIQEVLEQECKKWQENSDSKVFFWDRYCFGIQTEKFLLKDTKYGDRGRIHVDMAKWQTIEDSLADAISASTDVKYKRLEQRLNEAHENGNAIAERRYFKELALRDASYRLMPNWNRERSFLGAVRLACEDSDASFFLRLGKALSAKPKIVLEDKFTSVLLHNYATGKPPDGVFLALASDKVICEVVEKFGVKCNREMLKKFRSRLGLQKFRKPIFHRVVTLKSGLVVISRY